MPALTSIALGAAPVLGGALFGAMAGQVKGPDVRALIAQDLDLLDRIPKEQKQRRADLQRTIDARIDDLVAASDRAQAWRAAASSYEGNWRDIVLCVCAVLFTYVWWHVNHHRADWMPMFILLILACLVTAGYALRGATRSLLGILRRHE